MPRKVINLKKQKTMYIIFTIIIFLIILGITSEVYSADPKLVTKIKKAFEQIEDWIIKISTPVAAVAVCTGLLMKKFSFGDEERIRIGKKLVKSTLFSYAFILAIDLVLSAIKTLVA